ncbi:hypothetical protein CK203_059382 [Vitis vinifera]|uniref:Uncharacterized protein n=1 Tax=Vitis vinifera TaxID=29760 RepID=A0A438GF39_VITVI|nr:hypothetical protein CK203_059382 [Vitis vinifera]
MRSDVVFGSLYLDRSDSVVFGLPGSFMDPHGLARSSLTGCSLRRGHDRYLTEPLRSTHPGPHFSTLGCHHASPSGRSALLDAWMSSCFLPMDASLICGFDSVASMDDLSSSAFLTCYILDATLGHIPHLDRDFQILLSDIVVVLGRSYVECLDSHVTISPWRRSFSHRPVIVFVTQPRDIVFALLTIIPEVFTEISSQWSVDRDS